MGVLKFLSVSETRQTSMTGISICFLEYSVCGGLGVNRKMQLLFLDT
jgi:hypothetical protein